MLDFSSEIEALRPQVGDAKANALIARERREIVSLQPEVRIAAWAGALLIAAAVGLFVKEHFDLFDRGFLAAMLALAAAGCYAWAARRDRGTVSDYVLLLGALLLSADVGFIEQQYDLFGAQGHRHFLLLAVLHGAAAYVFRSRLVLSLSIAAVAAWMGLERWDAFTFDSELGLRAILCAALLLAWRAIDLRYRRQSDFTRVFEHFAANLALWGGLAIGSEKQDIACAVTLVIAAVVIWWGFRTRVESFVLYAFVYAVIAVDAWLFSLQADEALVVFLSMLIAVPALVFIHRRFRRLAA